MNHKWIGLTLFVLITAGCAARDAATVSEVASPSAGTSDQAPSVAEAPAGAATGDACGNPYYPVVDGSRWTYQIGEAGNTATHILSTGPNGTFKIQVEGQEAAFLIDGACISEGIAIMEVPGMTTTTTTEGSSSTVTSGGSEGVSLPNRVQVGDTWSQTVQASVPFGESLTDVTIESAYTATGIESVTVPAGTFNALRVDVQSTLDMGTGPVAFNQTLWYAEGIGAVKSLVEGAPVIELAAYEFP